MLNSLRIFVANPWVNFTVALVMLFAGISEGWDTFQEDIFEGNLRAHHGIILYGLLAMLKAIPDVFDGLEHILGEKEV